MFITVHSKRFAGFTFIVCRRGVRFWRNGRIISGTPVYRVGRF